MNEHRDGPFDTLESAHDFVGLLREAVDEAYVTILDETDRVRASNGNGRRIDALRLVDHKLNLLRQHLLASLLLLNDLRTLRGVALVAAAAFALRNGIV